MQQAAAAASTPLGVMCGNQGWLSRASPLARVSEPRLFDPFRRICHQVECV